MEFALSLSILVVSAGVLYVAGELLVSGLLHLARYFQVKEFIVAFFVMAFAASVPNFFVGITSATQGISELSFGDIMGNNMVALTIAVGLAVLFAPGRRVPLENKTVQDMTFLTAIAALLPVVLMIDGLLSRGDGLALVLFFCWYVYWIFSKRDRFSKVYDDDKSPSHTPEERREALKNLGSVLLGVTLLGASAQGIVYGASHLADLFHIPLVLVGLVMIGIAGALPEVYFTVISARKGETSMLIGNLMGAVIVPATLVLGLVAVINPIKSEALEFPIVARIFLIAVAFFFLYVSRTKDVITLRESAILLVLYVLFILSLMGLW